MLRPEVGALARLSERVRRWMMEDRLPCDDKSDAMLSRNRCSVGEKQTLCQVNLEAAFEKDGITQLLPLMMHKSALDKKRYDGCRLFMEIRHLYDE